MTGRRIDFHSSRLVLLQVYVGVQGEEKLVPACDGNVHRPAQVSHTYSLTVIQTSILTSKSVDNRGMVFEYFILARLDHGAPQSGDIGTQEHVIDVAYFVKSLTREFRAMDEAILQRAP